MCGDRIVGNGLVARMLPNPNLSRLCIYALELHPHTNLKKTKAQYWKTGFIYFRHGTSIRKGNLFPKELEMCTQALQRVNIIFY